MFKRLQALDMFYNPSGGRSEPSIDLNVLPSRNIVQRTESQAFKKLVYIFSLTLEMFFIQESDDKGLSGQYKL